MLTTLGIDFDDVVAILAGSGGALEFDPLAAIVHEGEAAAWAALAGRSAGRSEPWAGQHLRRRGRGHRPRPERPAVDDVPPGPQPDPEPRVGQHRPRAGAGVGMRLRLAVVALEDGGLAHVTEDEQLVRERNGGTDPVTTPDALVTETMASAAILGFFGARRLSTAASSMLYVDGGVREVLPSQAAVDRPADLQRSRSPRSRPRSTPACPGPPASSPS